jgi:hypothetical protein
MLANGVDMGEQPGLQTNAPGCSIAAPVHSYFKREVGLVTRAQLHFGQYSKLPRPTSPAAQRGVRYEKKVMRLLERRLGNRLVPGPFNLNCNQRCFFDVLHFPKLKSAQI